MKLTAGMKKIMSRVLEKPVENITEQDYYDLIENTEYMSDFQSAKITLDKFFCEQYHPDKDDSRRFPIIEKVDDFYLLSIMYLKYEISKANDSLNLDLKSNYSDDSEEIQNYNNISINVQRHEFELNKEDVISIYCHYNGKFKIEDLELKGMLEAELYDRRRGL